MFDTESCNASFYTGAYRCVLKVLRMPLRSSIYRKGAVLYGTGKVTLDVETEKGVYLFVDGEHQRYHVRLMSDGTFNCTCTLGSLRAGKGVLCSHIIGAILFKSGAGSSGSEGFAVQR